MTCKAYTAAFLLLAITSKAYANEVVQIVGEGTIDVGNLFKSFKPAEITVPSII